MATPTETIFQPSDRPDSHRNPGRARRWAVPALAVVVAAAGAGYGILHADASGGLAPKSAQEILTGMQQAKIQPLSGTVVAKADLGLPELPGMAESPELTSLVSGSHTVRVWYDGPERVRIAKLGSAGETDVIRNGRDAWLWSSADKRAVHHRLPADAPAGRPTTRPTPAPGVTTPATPDEASRMILEHLGESSTVSTNATSRIAGRDAYELVLTPKQGDTLVKDVRLAVDGETMMPLRVQVYSTKLRNPAYEVGFSSLALGDVEDRLFTFTPPPGTTVEEGASAGAPAPGHGPASAAPKAPTSGKTPDTARAKSHDDVAVSGTGWSRVIVATMPAGGSALTGGADDADARSTGRGQDAADVLAALPTASGAWGSGRVLEGTLFSAIVTDDGRVAFGAVESAKVGAALAKSTPR